MNILDKNTQKVRIPYHWSDFGNFNIQFEIFDLQIVDFRVESYNQINKITYSSTNTNMDIKDFQNTGKYKMILPIMYIFNWAFMFTGPFFYPIAYKYYVFFVYFIIAAKSTITFIWTLKSIWDSIVICRKYNRYLDSQNDPDNQQKQRLRSLENSQNIQEDKKLWFAFIIPSYKQDLELLGDTLKQLAKHPQAKKKYLVFMAMEAHEEGSAEKAKLLIQKYGNNFKLMSYSHHILRQNEQKGKAANVSWCGQRLEEHQFPKIAGLNPNDVFITVIDADSWVPHMYIFDVEQRIMNNRERGLKTIYQPAQLFTRNHMEVPMISRTYDQSHSAIHYSNVSSFTNIAASLSNYTLSFNLIKKIGFWDTCADAIGQDLHTVLKAFYKTNGDVYTQSVQALVNQVNVQTGNGYIADLKARFWQAQRHARGCADLAYSLKMFFQGQINFRTTFLTYYVFQIFYLPCIIPFAFVGDNIMNIIFHYFPQPTGMPNPQFGATCLNIASCTLLPVIIIFFCYYRYYGTKYYGLPKESILRVFEYLLTFISNIGFITAPAFVIAAFKVLLNKSQYNTAQKNVKNSTRIMDTPMITSQK